MSQVEDLEAINAYIAGTKTLTPAAAKLKNDWVKWWNENVKDSFWNRNFDENTFNVAREKRNAFNLANASTPAEKQAVKETVARGLTVEETRGEADPRDAEGHFYVEPEPLIPAQYKVAVGVGVVATVALGIYAFAKALPEALLASRSRRQIGRERARYGY